MGKSKKYRMNTKALHANKRFDPVSGDIMPPLHLSTTYINEVPGESDYFYGRVNNPTRELFERTLASLEGIENYEEINAFAILLIFFWPVADTGLAIWRRWKLGNPAGHPDRLHFHQLAMRFLEIRFFGRARRHLVNPLSTVVLVPLISAPQVLGVLFLDPLM